MKKMIALMIVALTLLINAETVYKREKLPMRVRWTNDSGNDIPSKLAFTGVQGETFDKSGNGYGWVSAFNRKVQVNHDPVTGTMLGSLYRRLNATYGSGTIGGMVGVWDGTFAGYAQEIYTQSPYQASGTLPGGRYPQTSEFINGYVFALFNDYDTITGKDGKTDGTISQPMFTVADATFGYDLSMWSPPKRIEATEGGTVIPGAWTGRGDVAYNPDDGYYYWTTSWAMGGLVETWEEMKTPFVVGRSNTPADPASWEWTDYNEINMDCTTGADFMYYYGDFQIAYAKDIYGNGNGYGIVVTPYVDDTYVVTNAAGDTLDVTSHERLGYMYTTNWGADWNTGDFKTNWVTPGNLGNNLIPADEVFKLFDWYGSIVTGDSIGVDSLGTIIYEETPMNWPTILANIDVVCTENNEVHVLAKVIGSSTEAPDYWYYANDEKTIAGYYDIVGQITETGVVWKSANYIATWMGMFDAEDTVEMIYSNWNSLAIGYAGNGVVYATWWDRPETRYVAVQTANGDITKPRTIYVDDGFFSYSPDNGTTWMIDKTVAVPDTPFEYRHAFNVTRTNTMDEGWTIATHGTNITPGVDDGVMTVYAACQYADTENPIEDPILSWFSYQQFLKVWKITGTGTGVETEEVSLAKDFTLYQNYPNPFNPATEIRFSIQNDANVKLAVYNTKGELVSNLKNEKMVKGLHTVNFDASNLNSGVYFYKLSVDGRAETKKMVLTK